MNSLDIHIGRRVPAVIVADGSRRIGESEARILKAAAEETSLPLATVNLATGENVEPVFRRVAGDICVSDES